MNGQYGRCGTYGSFGAAPGFVQRLQDQATAASQSSTMTREQAEAKGEALATQQQHQAGGEMTDPNAGVIYEEESGGLPSWVLPAGAAAVILVAAYAFLGR